MKYLLEDEANIAKGYLKIAAQIALDTNCLKAKRGALVVQGDAVIWKSSNALPAGVSINECIKDTLPVEWKQERNCCIQAEILAVTDALSKYPHKVRWSSVYFSPLNKDGEIDISRTHFDVAASKFMIQCGIVEYIVQTKEGICSIPARELYRLSFGFQSK